MPKRLTEQQKEEIVSSFKSGIAVEILSQNYSCTNATIIRNLKKNLGELKYKELFNQSKSFSAKSKNNYEQPKNLLKTNFKKQNFKKDLDDVKIFNENFI